MSMPFYVSPEQVMADKAEFARKGRMPALLLHHDPTRPVGTWKRIEEDSKGLRVEGQLVPGVPAADEARKLMRAGALTGLSIGYSVEPKGSTYDGARGVRILKELKLWEISLVAMPANDLHGLAGDPGSAEERRGQDQEPLVALACATSLVFGAGRPSRAL